MATATPVGINWDDTKEIVKGGFVVTPRPESYSLEVAAARAAVDASFEAPTPTHDELPVTAELFGGAKDPVFEEVDFGERFAKLQTGISNLSAAGIASM